MAQIQCGYRRVIVTHVFLPFSFFLSHKHTQIYRSVLPPIFADSVYQNNLWSICSLSPASTLRYAS